MASRFCSGAQEPLTSFKDSPSLPSQSRSLPKLPPWYLGGQREQVHTKWRPVHGRVSLLGVSYGGAGPKDLLCRSPQSTGDRGFPQPALARLQHNSVGIHQHAGTAHVLSFCGHSYPCTHIPTYVLALHVVCTVVCRVGVTECVHGGLCV